MGIGWRVADWVLLSHSRLRSACPRFSERLTQLDGDLVLGLDLEEAQDQSKTGVEVGFGLAEVGVEAISWSVTYDFRRKSTCSKHELWSAAPNRRAGLCLGSTIEVS